MIARTLITIAAILVGTTACRAQEPGKLRYAGSEVFRFALHKKDLKPVSQPQDVLRNPTDSVIVIFGDTSQLSTRLSTPQLKQYIENGGSVFIASDSSSAAWGRVFGIRISGRHLLSEKQNCYREISTRPFIKPKQGIGGVQNSPFAIVQGFDATGTNAVATDRPSEMFAGFVPGYRLKVLATYPDRCRDANGLVIPPAGNNFAVSQETDNGRGLGVGRLLVMADNSVFANGMMGVVDDPNAKKGYSFDNANWEFTNRTIDWIRSGPFNVRTRCLFIEDGQIIEKFAVELPRTPMPPRPELTPEKLLAIANVVLRMINQEIPFREDQNFFNQVLARKFGLPRLWRIFIVTVTVMFLFAALARLIRGGRKHERATALTPSLVAGAVPRGGMFQQRTAAQLEVGNLYEAARRRVRDRFDVLGARPGESGRMPPILTANDVHDAPLMYQTIRGLWLIGYAETPTAVTPTDWDRLNALLERVSARAARGDWSFGQEVA